MGGCVVYVRVRCVALDRMEGGASGRGCGSAARVSRARSTASARAPGLVVAFPPPFFGGLVCADCDRVVYESLELLFQHRPRPTEHTRIYAHLSRVTTAQGSGASGPPSSRVEHAGARHASLSCGHSSRVRMQTHSELTPRHPHTRSVLAQSHVRINKRTAAPAISSPPRPAPHHCIAHRLLLAAAVLGCASTADRTHGQSATLLGDDGRTKPIGSSTIAGPWYELPIVGP